MRQTLKQAFHKLAGPEATSARIARIAKEGHARIMETAPRPSDYVRRVDGVRGAPEEDVRPDGVIIYTYARLQPIVDYALEVLRSLSPALSGAYRDAHVLLINGAPAADASGALPGETVVITNPLPYSRKIERGAMTMRVPGTDQVYQQAAQLVQQRFGNQAWIKFTYQSAIMDYVRLGGRRGGKAAGTAHRSAHSMETAARVPALTIRAM